MSSSTKLQFAPACNGTTVESIPLDLLLEIVARSDTATIVRCAATCKLIRRAVQDASFRRRIALRDEASDAILLGVSYAFLDPDQYCSSGVTCVGQAPRQNLPFDAGLLESFEPMTSRRGLIVLRGRDGYYHELRVCNNLTGHAFRLPSSDLTGPHALLTVDDAGRSFKLLVTDESLRRMQVFSTEDDRWGAVVQTQPPPGFWRRSNLHRFSNPVVRGGTTIHWLHVHDGIEIIALDCSTARATSIELPLGCCNRVRWSQSVCNALQLAASADGRLSLLVAETCVISMWTLSAMPGEEEGSSPSLSAPAARWTRQVVIKRRAIGREEFNFSVRFLGFGELSSTMILLMDEIGLVQINLRTKEALVLRHGFKVGFDKLQMCLHETYLPSLLLAMRAF